MKFETERLILRQWQESDLGPFAQMNADLKVMEYMPKRLSQVESEQFIAKIQQGFDKNSFGLWAIELKKDQSFLGFTGLSTATFEADFTPAVEVGWRLRWNVWGKGFATEAATKALELGFGMYNLREIFSFTSSNNIRSRSVMEKIGMSCDPKDNFDHPLLPPESPLKNHVLYKIHQAKYLFY